MTPTSSRPTDPTHSIHPTRRTGAVGARLLASALILASCGRSGLGAVTTTISPHPAPAPTATAPTTTAPAQPAGVGPERVPIPNGPPLGAVDSATYGQPIDGIQCQKTEQVVYHIHAHLAVFVNGQPRQVPYAIGIGPPVQVTTTAAGVFASGGSCFYWLHTHASDGVIHIESPSPQLYTLGQFFDVWGQPLGPGQVGAATGTVTVYVDGQPVTGNPRDVELKNHGQIQLDVGSVVAPQPIDWSQTSL